MLPKMTILSLPTVISNAKLLLSKGVTQLSKTNLFYLKIDNEYVHTLFTFLEDANIKKPDYFGENSEGAHITIIYPEERKIILQQDLQQEYSFSVKNIAAIEIGHKIYYTLLIDSPSLLKIRSNYALPPLLCFKGYSIDFHVTIGVKDIFS